MSSGNQNVNANEPDQDFIDAEHTVSDSIVQLPSNLGTIQRAEIDQQIATAKRYPRKVSEVLKEAQSMACEDEKTAMTMYYNIPRGGKNIEGPSIRLAEVIASTWGNLRVQARIVESSDDFVTVQAMCHDLERNTAVSVEKRRRVTKKKTAKRPDADDINIAGLAGMSIALRDAVFKVVPRVYVDRIMLAAQRVGLGDAKSVSASRQTWFEYFAKMRIKPEQIFAALGVAGMEDVGVEEMVKLRGYATAIKDGEAKLENVFPPLELPNDKPKGNDATLNAIKEKQPAKPAETATKPATPAPEAEKPKEAAKMPPVQKPAPKQEPAKPAPTPAPVKEHEPPPVAEVASPKEVEESPSEIDDREETPAWYDNWITTIAAMSPKTWERTRQCLNTLVGQIKEEINAHQKPHYEELIKLWAERVAEMCDKPSMLLVAESVVKPLEKVLTPASYAHVVDVLAKKKAAASQS